MRGAEISRPPAHRVTLAQLLVLLLIWLGVGSWDANVAYSALLGGLVAVLPQAWFAHRVFRRQGAQAAMRMARAVYAAEIGKFVMAAAGFALVFALVRPIVGWAVFAAYGVMLIIQVIGAWYLLRLASPRFR
jgi:ATP synthase protein I